MSFQNGGLLRDLVAVTLSDTAANNCMGLYVGTGGDLKITTGRGTAVTLSNVPSGAFLPIETSLVWSTGTTASNVLGGRG